MALTDALPKQNMSFAQIVDQKKLYVDKSDKVASLARRRGPFYLSRSPRMGKSLLLSTFKELFENGTGRFAGLKLEQDRPWTDESGCKVIRLDLSNNEGADDKKQSFRESFISTLALSFEAAGVAWGDNAYWVLNLEGALEQFSNSKLVLLVDDYDAPLMRVLDDPQELEIRCELWYDFFATLKIFVDKLRFAFTTGSCEFDRFGVFEGGDNIHDLSCDPHYGAILGFTQVELEQNFMPFIADAANVLKEKEPQERWDEQKILEALKDNYGGFSFDRKKKHQVYNPWSVINFLCAPNLGFERFRLESGGDGGLS